MRKKLLAVLCISILSFNLVACSNKYNTQTNEVQNNGNTESYKIDREQILFDKEVIIVDDNMIEAKLKGKEKITPGDSIGYIFSISNESDQKIEFYVKDVIVDGKERKTELEEYLKMTLEPNTDFSTQLTIIDIKSLDELKNTSGVFCIGINNEIKEYRFEF